MRRPILAVLALSLAACTATTGPALYPDVAGTYDVTGTLGNGSGVGPFVATITITQPSLESGDLSGALSMLTNTGTYSVPVPMERGTVTHAGAVTLCSDYNPAQSLTWCFTGQRAPDGSITGRHSVADSTTTYASGDWTGRKR